MAAPSSPPSDLWGSVPGATERDGRGAFVRPKTVFRNWITNDRGAQFPAEPGRYHLYVAMSCPWASRTVTVRALKGLEDVVGLSIVDPIRDERGWAFRDVPGATGDHLNGWEYLSSAYVASQPDYSERVSVPVLWDSQTGQIVNNESADVIVMLDQAFNEWAAHPELDLYPAELRESIDEVNDWVYREVNNGVYLCGFAASQAAYDESIGPLFAALDRLDARLADQRYLAGAQHTLADWRLFPTLMRFDLCYHGIFRCNRRRIVDYPNLWPYLRDLYQTPRVADSVNIDHFVRGYHLTQPQLNPSGILPIGPDLDFMAPHGRERLSA